jgi:hypothetical protein
MTERLRTFLLAATLMAATAGATAAVLDLKAHQTRAPALRLGQEAPVDWHGWRLVPPSDLQDSCYRDGYDACSDEGEDGEPTGLNQDNEPLPT